MRDVSPRHDPFCLPPALPPEGVHRECLAKKVLVKCVGTAGFEPATSCSQSRRAAKLRYVPVSGGGDSLTE